MAAQTPIYKITPNKFTIYDSELSDGDSDSEEWVSISTSATAGTVPNHITLRPRAHNLPTALIHKPKVKQIISNPERRVQPLPPQNAYTTATSLSTIKQHLPTLKAVYIVNPSSIYPTCRQYSNCTTRGPFVSFCNLSSAPAGLHIPSGKECYLRVCGDCVRCRIVLVCDGTWWTEGEGVCEKHEKVIRGGEGMGIGIQGENERARDIQLFEAVVHLMQPFSRAQIEKIGFSVFDMVEDKGEKGFVHKEGCKCEEK